MARVGTALRRGRHGRGIGRRGAAEIALLLRHAAERGQTSHPAALAAPPSMHTSAARI